MFLRPHPSSPLSTISYTNTTINTPDNAHQADPTSLKTPLKAMQQTPARGGSTGGGAAFPPELGSSSPPMSSPTSYRDLQPSFYSDASSSRTQRGQQSSAGMFAARARALQPPLQRSSSLMHGSGSSASTMDNQHFRYGRRPGIRKSTTGSGYGGDSCSQTSNSTGYSLFYKPAQTSSQELPAARPSSTQRPAFIPSMPPPAAVGMEQSIQGTMWKGRFRQRCIASSQRREGSDGMGDPAAEEDNEAEEAEHEEIFRRMIQKEQRKKAHRIAVSFEQEVGGSDPAVWEAEVREAEKIGVSLPEEDGMERGTPQKSVDAQWQYRSATKYQHFPLHARSSGNGKTASPAHQRTQAYRTSERDGVDDDEHTEEAAQYAAFLQAQADEDRLLAEYANDAAPTTYHAHTNPRQHPSAAAGEGGIGAANVGIEEQPAADTPGAELGIEMQGFTWEDAPLSDEDESGNGTQDVEMV